jgi:hypothetical protein
MGMHAEHPGIGITDQIDAVVTTSAVVIGVIAFFVVSSGWAMAPSEWFLAAA